MCKFYFLSIKNIFLIILQLPIDSARVSGYPQGHFEQSSPVTPATAPMAGQPVISLPPGGQAASYAPPPFLVPPPQFIPPQTAPPSIINYVPGPNGPTFPPNFQGYQGYNPSVQVRRTNLFKY